MWCAAKGKSPSANCCARSSKVLGSIRSADFPIETARVGCTILAAHRTVAEYSLQRKLPHLGLVRDLKLEFLPDNHFDVVHAHSVFSHSPLPVIEECLRHVGRVMVPGGMFDFTFDRTDGSEHQVLREDFYYRTETLVELARSCGLEAQYMPDWEETGHEQSKIRAIRPA